MPAGIFLSLITTLIATEFKDFLGLSAAAWQAVYLLSAIGSGLWLLIAIGQAWKARNKGDINRLINSLTEDQ